MASPRRNPLRPTAHRHAEALLLALLIGMTWSESVHAADADLDTGFGVTTIVSLFGRDGTAFTPGGDTDAYGSGMAIQADGKIVMAGHRRLSVPFANSRIALVRFCPDGSLDNGINCGPGGFGTGGEVTHDIGAGPLGPDSRANAVAVQVDGKIVAAGWAGAAGASRFVAVRYCSDGRLDDGVNCGGPGFGTGGIFSDTPLADPSEALAVAVQADGKIVLAGLVYMPDSTAFAMGRLCPDGRVDDGVNCGGPGFGYHGDGFVSHHIAAGGRIGTASVARALAIQADGKLVVAGTTGELGDFAGKDFALMRFCPDGTLDDGVNCGGAGFGEGGDVRTDVSGQDEANAIAIQGDGKIVVAGCVSCRGNYPGDVGFARYCPDGKLDDGVNCGGAGFGDAGTVTVPFTSANPVPPWTGHAWTTVNGLAIQADGKIVGAGWMYFLPSSGDREEIINQFIVTRLCPDGSLDDGAGCGGAGFGTNARVVTAIEPTGVLEGSSNGSANAVVLQRDGKIVAGGTAFPTHPYPGPPGANWALARYCSDGRLDDGVSCNLVFSEGTAITSIRNQDEAYAMALQPDGKIVLAGGADMRGSNAADFAVVRYCANGRVDDGVNCGAGGFGAAGKVTTNFASYNDFASAVAVQPDGKIVTAGVSLQGSYQAMALARYCANGLLDDGAACGGAGFGIAGKVVTAFAFGGLSRGFARAIVLQADGKIVVAGFAGASFALARYCSDGRLDDGINCGAGGFGSGGRVTTAFGAGIAQVYALVLQPDGKLVAAGSVSDTILGPAHFALARYCPNGTLDDGASCGAGGFGTAGRVVTAIAAGNGGLLGLVIQPDGKLLAAGYTSSGGSNDFALVRYCADGRLDDGGTCGAGGFGSGGVVTTTLSAGHDLAFGVAVQADGKIVVAGYATVAGRDFAVGRYCSDGRLDDGVACGESGFGNAGTTLLDFAGGSVDIATAVLIQPDGKILVGGHSSGEFALVRFNGTSSPPPDGLVFHALVMGVDANTGTVSLGPLESGDCPDAINCLEFTVIGSFTVEGTILGLLPGSQPTLTIPIADGSGNPAGTRRLACSAADAGGMSTCAGTVEEPNVVPLAGAVITVTTVLPDVIPPTTTALAAGVTGENGWYRSSVTVTLGAVDNPGGSGVRRTYYAVDTPGCTPAARASCLTYTGTFAVAGDGNHSVDFWSEDHAGNVEAPRSQLVKIDVTPPVVVCSASPTVLWPANHKLVPVTVAVDVSDPTSGTRGFTIISATSNEPDDGTGDGDTANDIQGFQAATGAANGALRAERSAIGRGRIYTLTYRATDQAGNSAACTTAVTVPHDRR